MEFGDHHLWVVAIQRGDASVRSASIRGSYTSLMGMAANRRFGADARHDRRISQMVEGSIAKTQFAHRFRTPQMFRPKVCRNIRIVSPGEIPLCSGVQRNARDATISKSLLGLFEHH